MTYNELTVKILKAIADKGFSFQSAGNNRELTVFSVPACAEWTWTREYLSHYVKSLSGDDYILDELLTATIRTGRNEGYVVAVEFDSIPAGCMREEKVVWSMKTLDRSYALLILSVVAEFILREL